METTGKIKKKAWTMWAVMVITYMFNTFHSSEMGVIREKLIGQFLLSEDQFVSLTNAFSYTYMIMQIPAGIFLDRFGAKRVAVIGNMTAAVGTVLFATAVNYLMLLAGRAIIGIGCSVCFISVLKICTEWFDEKMFCTLSGLTTLVGMSGALIAQAPLAALTEYLSWHVVFVSLAGMTVLTVLLILLFVEDRPEGGKSVTVRRTDTVRAIRNVLRNPYTWPPLLVYGCFYGTYLLISGVYGTSIIAVFYQCTSIQASSCISTAVLGCAMGSVFIGILSDRLKNRKYVQSVTGIIYATMWFVLLLGLRSVTIFWMYLVMFLLGFCSCAYAVCWSCVKEYNDPAYAGISTSIANMGGYLGSIVVPALASGIYTGALMSETEAMAFGKVILMAAAVNILGVIISFSVKETRGENIWELEEKIFPSQR